MKTRTLIIVIVGLAVLLAGVITAQRFEWLSENQATALLASLIPLFGVLVTLQWSHKQFLHQLDHQRSETESERRFRLKQDAFIAAAEAVLSASAYINSLPERQLPSDGVAPPETRDFAAALAKLHFFAELKTIEVVVPLSRVITTALLEVTAAKLPSAFTAADIDTTDCQIAYWEKQNAEIALLIQAIVQGHPDHQSIGNLIQQRANNLKLLGELQGKKAEQIAKRYSQIEDCRDAALKFGKLITPSALSFYLCAREELGFQIDAKSYRELMTAETQAVMDQMEKFVTEVRGEVRRRME